jgi:hypothetical protein
MIFTNTDFHSMKVVTFVVIDAETLKYAGVA